MLSILLYRITTVTAVENLKCSCSDRRYSNSILQANKWYFHYFEQPLTADFDVEILPVSYFWFHVVWFLEISIDEREVYVSWIDVVFWAYCCRFEEFAGNSDWNVLGGSTLCWNITWCYNEFYAEGESYNFWKIYLPRSALSVFYMTPSDRNRWSRWTPTIYLMSGRDSLTVSWYRDWTLLVSGSQWIGISSIQYFNNIALLCLHNRIPREYSSWISVRYEIYCDLIT